RRVPGNSARLSAKSQGHLNRERQCARPKPVQRPSGRRLAVESLNLAPRLCTASLHAHHETCKELLQCCGSITRRKKRRISTSRCSRIRRSNRSRITPVKNFPKRKAR